MAKDWIKQHQDKNSSWESGEEEASKQGRPKIEKSKKRKPRFTLNLNDEEFELLTKACDLNGEQQASFARQAVIEKARKLIKES